MERFITVLQPLTQLHANLACETLESMDISVILAHNDSAGAKTFRLMVPERFSARAMMALKGLDCTDISARRERGIRHSEATK